MTKTYTSNTTETVTIKDLAGNSTTVNIKINNINKTAPIAQVSYSITSTTNQDVVVTIKANEQLQTVSGWALSSDRQTLTKTYASNTTENVTIKDLAGNTTTVNIKITNIDKTAPTAQVSYSTTELTNQNVVVTIKANKQLQAINDWTLLSDKQTLTKTYTSNTTETVTIKDLAGNTATVTVKIANIDKTAPTAQVSYSTTELTNQDVVVTIKANKQLQSISGWLISADKLSLTKTYVSNTTENVTIKDLAGNTTAVTVKIANIDKTAPTAQISYSTTELTNEDVVVTIKANEKIQEVDGGTLSSDKLSLTKIYSTNTTENITIKDLAGNTTAVKANITNIDKMAPAVQVSYSTTELTNQNVVVTIKANEKIQEVDGWILSTDKLSLTKTYTSNITENITIKDIAGNTTTVAVKITNIEKTELTGEVIYSIKELTNQDVVATIKANKQLQPISGWTLSTDKLSLTKTYISNTTETVTIKDLAGNSTTVNIKINNIDKTAPIAQVSYSITSTTNQDVTVTIKANEQLQTINGWSSSTDKLSLTKTYATNTTENITIKDLVGNTTTVNIKITNIDKTAPTAQVSYSTTELTNQNVVVTIKANKQLQAINDWTLLSDKQTLTKTYTSNTTETVTIKDLAGNTATVTVKIANIDKTAPTAQVSYSITELTNQDVVVTIKASEQLQILSGWTLSTDKLSLTKTYTSNTTENVTIKDLAGNTTTVTVKITNIEKSELVAVVTYSITESTNQNVVVKIKANKQLQAINGWTLLSDKQTMTKTYTSNVTENITIKDLAGNTATVNVKITNIDKTAPTAQLSYSTTELTNQDVVVTIKANEQLQAINGWSLSTDKLSLTKTYAINTTEDITIKDLAGNIATVTIKISNIDKTAPIAQVSYSTTELTNQDVVVTIKANEKIQKVDGWTLSIDKLSMTKTYTSNTTENVTIKDLAGNTTTVTINVANINKKQPTFELKQYQIKDNYIVKIKPKTKYRDFIKDIETNQKYTIKEKDTEISGEDLIKTGQTLTTEDGHAYTLVVIGDLSGDGKIGLVELARISKIGAGKITDIKEIEKMAIDVNADGKINIIDLAAISKYATE